MAWTAKPSTHSFHALSQQGVTVLLNTVSLCCCCCLFLISLLFPSCRRSTKTHPGPVVHLSDSPKDEGKVSRQIKNASGFSSSTNFNSTHNLQRLFLFTESSASILFFSVTYLSFNLHSALLVSSFSLFSVCFLCFCLLSFSFSHLSLSQPVFLSGSQQEKNILYTLYLCSHLLFTYIHRRREVWGTCGWYILREDLSLSGSSCSQIGRKSGR